jgi:hypothetical protein
MEVVSVSPFRAGSVLWRSGPDRHTLTVICKATYALTPGEATLAAEQDDVNERDNHWDDDTLRSVYAPGDLAPFKPRADVMLVGHAFAPRSELARSLVARLVVGEIDKAIEVTSPRVWTREGELREGARWNKMPLRWEYSAGGADTWNPVGVSMHAQPDAYGQRLLPNLQPPGLRIAQWADFFVPVGFGPVASTWRLRTDKLGPLREGWSEDTWMAIPLDGDFDGEFFQQAPPDQQLDTLHDDESIVLEYLHPEHPRLTTKLPGLHPRAFVDVRGASAHDLVMTADTLWIDTDRAICTLTWRGQVAVEDPDQEGRVVLVMEEAGQRLPWQVVAALAGKSDPAPSESPTTPPHTRMLPFRLAEPSHLAASPAAASVAAPSSETADAEPRATPRAVAPPRTLPLVTPANYAPAAPAWASREDTPEPTNVSARPTAEAPSPSPRGPALELIWHASSLTGRLRRNGAWAKILAPAPKGTRTTMTMVSIARPDSEEAKEHALETDVSTILARGEPYASDLEKALFEGVTNGALVPELRLFAGSLDLVFDEVATIGALVTAVSPLTRADAYLAELVEHARAMARTPLQHTPEVAAELASSLREGWARANRSLPPEHLDALAHRALLASRAYQRRDVLGETWVRALFTVSTKEGDGAAVPVYLPEAAARRLPLYGRIQARLLAEVVARQDEQEKEPVALIVRAIGRMVEPRKTADE